MTFVVANDKKIRLFKLKKQFIEDYRGSIHENQQDGDGQQDEESTFAERFISSNGEIIFPKTAAYYS